GEFWPSALAAGAVAAIVSSAAILKIPPTSNSIVISSDNMTIACSNIAAAFYGYPGQKLKMVGVTGTNGKTTTTHLIEYFLTKSSLPTALIGTLYTRWPGFEQTSINTTPFAVDLQQQLANAINAGCEVVVMEVSSHALDQGRVLNCDFEVAVFTNLTQDHLDYHGNMEDYFAAKASLFSPDYLRGKAIINADDIYGQRLIASTNADQVWSYSVNNNTANFWMSDLNYQPNGVSGILHTPQGNTAFSSPLVGQYNLENLLAAVA
ncbi:MAG: Mur ligase family protein, partial [Dolichospermum sp.]